jgi:hypothetical protein
VLGFYSPTPRSLHRFRTDAVRSDGRRPESRMPAVRRVGGGDGADFGFDSANSAPVSGLEVCIFSILSSLLTLHCLQEGKGGWCLLLMTW